jgi:hypothetical protein
VPTDRGHPPNSKEVKEKNEKEKGKVGSQNVYGIFLE